jgi:hypothetical protein
MIDSKLQANAEDGEEYDGKTTPFFMNHIYIREEVAYFPRVWKRQTCERSFTKITSGISFAS